MKYKILIFIILATICNASAQKYIGIKAGYTMSNIAFNPKIETKKLFGNGYDYGLIFKQYDSEYVGLQAELHFTNRGYRSLAIDSLDFDRKRINTYIELPSFIQFRINVGFAYLNVNVGPYFAYLLSSQVETSNYYVVEHSDYEFNSLRDNRFDYGIAGGIGLSHDFRWGSLQVEGRYSYGLGDLFSPSYPNNPSQTPARCQSVIVSYCYIINKK